MREDNQKAKAVFKAGPGLGWSALTTEFNRWFRLYGVNDIENQLYNERFSSFLPGSKAYYEFALHFFYQKIYEHPNSDEILSRLRVTQPSKVKKNEIVIDGLNVSWDLLLSVNEILIMSEFEKEILNGRLVIADLGSGWGRLGHVLMRINPKHSYIALDLPESLLIAHSYLPTQNLNVNSHSYLQARMKSYFEKDYFIGRSGFHFLGSQMLEYLESGSIDLFVNIASFGEMQFSQVTEYFRLIDEKCSGFFYTKQIKLDNTKDGFISETGGWPYPKNWQLVFSGTPVYTDSYFESIYKVTAIK